MNDAQDAVVIMRLLDRDSVGSTLLGVISHYEQNLAVNGNRLALAGVNADVLEQLDRTGVIDSIGQDNIFLEQPGFCDSLQDAIDAGKNWIDLQTVEPSTWKSLDK